MSRSGVLQREAQQHRFMSPNVASVAPSAIDPINVLQKLVGRVAAFGSSKFLTCRAQFLESGFNLQVKDWETAPGSL
jgi:hypothetical protein